MDTRKIGRTRKAKARKEEESFQEQTNAYAHSAIDNIREMVEALEKAENDQEREDAEQAVQEDALSVEVRSEYNILITTGGPAARIIGELDQHRQPKTARFEYQDWGKPWTEANTTRAEEAVLLKYAQQFWFGE